MSKPIIMKVYIRDASTAYKKKKMLESQIKQEITWSDFLNVCVDHFYNSCSFCGTKSKPSSIYLNNYDFYIRKEKVKDDPKKDNVITPEVKPDKVEKPESENLNNENEVNE